MQHQNSLIRTFAEILIERKYFGKVAAGAIVYARDTKRFLVLQRAKDKPDSDKKVMEPGTWSITVSGKKDKEDASTRETVYREFKEELGHTGRFRISEKPIDIFKDGEFRFDTYLIKVNKEFKPTLNWEHDAYKWVRSTRDIPKPWHFGTKRLIKKGKIR